MGSQFVSYEKENKKYWNHININLLMLGMVTLLFFMCICGYSYSAIKFFPMNGDEDVPYVAFQLNLQDKQDKDGLSPGQEILVNCNAWYEDVERNLGKGEV